MALSLPLTTPPLAWRSLLVMLLLAMAGIAGAAPVAEKAWRAGVAAYRSGDYATALERFGAAEQAGLRTPALDYNLGLTLYRLGHWAAAEQTLRRAALDPTYRGPSQYQLALLAQRRGDTAAARRWLDVAERSDPALAPRVALARARLGPPPPTPRNPYYLFLGAGYDSNVSLTDDSPQDERIAGAFVEGIGQIRHERQGLEAGLRGYVQHNLADSEFHVLAVDAEGLFRRAAGRHTLRLGPALGGLRFGGETFSRQIGLRLYWDRALADGWRSQLRYEGERIQAVPAQSAYDGQRHRLRYHLLMERSELWYTLEVNRRQGFTGDGLFLSQSPLRHSLGGQVRLPAPASLRLQAGGQVRHSRYAEPDRRPTADGGSEDTRRVETRYTLHLTARGPTRRWGTPMAEVNGAVNQGRPALYDYRRVEMLVGLEWH